MKYATRLIQLPLFLLASAIALLFSLSANAQTGTTSETDRQARTPRQAVDQLAAVYGNRLDQVAYIPALPLIAKLRLSELTGDSKHAEKVHVLVTPFLRGEKSPIPKSGSEQAGHLLFAELAARADGKDRDRWIVLCRAAADQIFDKDDKPFPVMPFHNEMSDAVFMAGPILVATGKLTGERKYIDAAVTHFASMRKFCIRPDGLYRHSPLCDAAWGRGNGFPALGLAFALSDWPDVHPARKNLLADFQKHMAALKSHQDAKTGCWHQVIDHPGSYDEYSCTCMIACAMQRGIKRGWLPRDEYKPCVDKAWRAIQERTSPDGKLVNVCITDKQKTLKDYLERRAIKGRDDRGGAMALLFATELLAAEKSGTIDTIAGSGFSKDNGPMAAALSANMNQPFGLEIGPDGALYICERGLHRIRRWDPKTKLLSTYAGTGMQGFAGDGGPATDAHLSEPHELRFDRDGNLYWTDKGNHVIRRVERKSGIIATFAGIGGKAGFGGDGGPGPPKAMFSQPHSLAFDGADNLYVADIGNHRIRRIDAKTGCVETFAGTGAKQLPKDGAVAKTSPILGPRALFVAGDVMWIALREGHAVWKLDLKKGTLHHVGGDGKAGFAVANGPVKDARFSGPKGIAVGPDGMVYVVDSGNHVLRKFDPEKGNISIVAGAPGKAKFSGDGGPAADAHLNNLHGVCITADGTIYIGDSDNQRVRRVHP